MNDSKHRRDYGGPVILTGWRGLVRTIRCTSAHSSRGSTSDVWTEGSVTRSQMTAAWCLDCGRPLKVGAEWEAGL